MDKPITEEQLDTLGRLADQADNLVGASQLRMPPEFHKEQLVNGLTEMSGKIKALYQEITGENPWDGP